MGSHASKNSKRQIRSGDEEGAPLVVAAGESEPEKWDDVLKLSIGIGERKGSGSTMVCADLGKEVYHFSCIVEGHKKDQDRFVVVPKLLKNPEIFFGGVFDGHGRDGDIYAESVARALPETLWKLLTAHTKKNSKLDENVLKSSILKAFDAIQKTMDTEFERDVVIPTQKLKTQLEEAQNVSLGQLTLPMGSGCTATAFLILKGLLCLAHVGDSRAVLCELNTEGTNELLAKDLTMDHNIACAPKSEIRRVKMAGATLTNRHLAVDFVDGMLQLTRSLGDIPLHRSGAVLHEPELVFVPINNISLFFIAASDGLWDSFTSEEACRYVFQKVMELHKTNVKAKRVTVAPKILEEVSASLEQEAADRMVSKGHQSDDISVMIVAFQEWWNSDSFSSSMTVSKHTVSIPDDDEITDNDELVDSDDDNELRTVEPKNSSEVPNTEKP